MNYQRILARSGSILALAVTFFVALSLVLWWLAFGKDRQIPPTAVELPITQSAAISWLPDGSVRLEHQAEEDTWALLGYAHGMQRAWTMILLRQAALGQLGTWFGPQLLPFDAHLKPLIRPDDLEQTFASLPVATQERLVSFADGVNAALASEKVQFEEPLVLLGRAVAPWEPWHTLLLERLYAWIAADLSPPSPELAPEVHSFWERDRSVRTWLGLHGMSSSLAWAAQKSGEQFLGLRFVYGSLGHRFALHIVHPDSSVALYAPGLPRPWAVLRTQKQGAAAWVAMMESSARVEQRSFQVRAQPSRRADITYRHWRLDAEGIEEVVEAAYSGDALLLGYDVLEEQIPDSIVQQVAVPAIAWTGFQHMTDAQQWAMTDQWDMFVQPGLWTSSGIVLDASGISIRRSQGQARVVERDSLTVMGRSAWAAPFAEALEGMAAEDLRSFPQAEASASPWALRTVDRWLSGFASAETDAVGQESQTYLRNWRGNFASESIGATLFDRWAALFARDSLMTVQRSQAEAEGVPALGASDSLFVQLRLRALQQAVRDLAQEYGPDVSQWQWGNVSNNVLQYPVWNDTMVSIGRANTPPHGRYAPVFVLGVGHPSAFLWAPTQIAPSQLALPQMEVWSRAPAAVELVMNPGRGTYQIREPRLAPHRFLARFLEEGSASTYNLLNPTAPPEARTTVEPSKLP